MIIEQVRRNGWHYNRLVHTLYIEGKIKLVSSEWGSEFNRKHADKLDLRDGSRWSSHERCTDVFLYAEGKRIYINVKLYEGNNFDGSKEGLRFEATFSAGPDVLDHFKEAIEYELTEKAEEVWEKEQKAKHIIEIVMVKDRLLRDINKAISTKQGKKKNVALAHV